MGGGSGGGAAPECGGNGFTVCTLCQAMVDAGTAACSDVDGGPTSVRLRRSVIHVDQAGDETWVADDLSTAKILVKTGPNTWQEFFPDDAGTPGEVFFSRVPPGPRYVAISDSPSRQTFYDTCLNDLDLSEYVLGRVDADFVQPSENIQLTLNVSNLEPWKTDDSLEFSAPNAGLAYSSFWPPDSIGAGALESNVPDAGVTQWSITLDWANWWYPSRITSADTMRVYQLAQRVTDAGIIVHTVVNQCTPQNIDMTTPNMNYVVDVPLGGFTGSSHLDAVIDRASFLPALGIAPDPGGESADVDPVPPDGGHGLTGSGAPDLLLTSFALLDGGTLPLDAGLTHLSVDYGNPFPDDWRGLFIYSIGATPYLTIPGSLQDGGAVSSQLLSDGLRVTLAPDTLSRIGVVQAFLRVPTATVNGSPISVGSSITTSTTIRASSSTQGELCVPNVYGFSFLKVSFDPSQQQLVRMGRFEIISANPSVEVPPQLLQPGQYYSLAALTELSPSFDWRRPRIGGSDLLDTTAQTQPFCVLPTDGGRCPVPDGGM
jgi:hypothetical protein